MDNNKCELCDKTFKKVLIVPACCQKFSESKYKLCTRCINKVTKCPFCRSPKQENIISKSLIFEIDYMVRLQALFRMYNEDISMQIGSTLYGRSYERLNNDEYYQMLVDRSLNIILHHISTKMNLVAT